MVLPRSSILELAERPREQWRLRDHANILYGLFPSATLLVQSDHVVLVSIMGQEDGGSFLTQLGQAGLKAALTVAAIYLIGRRVIRPLFHLLAANRQADTFMALTLLTSLGVAALTWHAGLSMALGALLAGLIIAETEFRHAVEVTIEPFKELLMGLFFMSVGMGIDVTELLAQPLWLPLSVVGLILIKGLIVFVLFRLSGLSYGRAVEGGLLLGSSGEFAFSVIGMALGLGLLTREVGQFMLLVVGFGMLATPLAARLGQSIGTRIDRRHGTHAKDTVVNFGYRPLATLSPPVPRPVPR